MGLMSSEASVYNSMEKYEIRKGGDTAISTYNQAIEAISRYEVQAKLREHKGIQNVTSDMLKEIQTQVNGRETMGEVSQQTNIYIDSNDEIDR